MKWRITDNDGELIVEKQGHVHTLLPDGNVWCVGTTSEDGWLSSYLQKEVGPYTLEFAFERDAQGNWLYEHCVMCK